METKKIEDLLSKEENKYYNSKYLITVLESVTGKKIGQLKKEVESANVTVNKEQIEEYLDKKFEEENPELKKRIKNSKSKKDKKTREEEKLVFEKIDITKMILDDIINITRYKFDPYTLEYYKKYIGIVKNKTGQLLNIIEKIGTNRTNSINDILSNLDINIDMNNDMSKEDIIRLIKPTVYNIEELNNKVKEANNLSTYLEFKISKYSLYRRGISENEIYPNSSIQIKNLMYIGTNGNIELSKNQKERLRKEETEIAKKIVKVLH